MIWVAQKHTSIDLFVFLCYYYYYLCDQFVFSVLTICELSIKLQYANNVL